MTADQTANTPNGDAEPVGAATGDGAKAHGHGSVQTYVIVGAVLTIITAVEVAIFYIEQLASVLAPILLTLSASKFVTVVLFYMHLRYDSPIFRRVFFGPLMLAVAVVGSLIILFKVLPVFI